MPSRSSRRAEIKQAISRQPTKALRSSRASGGDISSVLGAISQARGPRAQKLATGLSSNAPAPMRAQKSATGLAASTPAPMQAQKVAGKPRFGGPQGGRPTLASGQIKSLGIQPVRKVEGKRRYLR